MSSRQALHRLASCAASALHPPPRPPSRVLLLHRFASRSSVLLSASLFGPSAPSPTMASADSCNRFASGFLPTLGHPRRRCLPLTLAHVGCVKDFHLQVSAPCRAHQKKAAQYARLFYFQQSRLIGRCIRGPRHRQPSRGCSRIHSALPVRPVRRPTSDIRCGHSPAARRSGHSSGT
jgi:hypothetical protein